MDKVTQQNAATAEESPSSSEEMNAQAEQMKGMVDDLMAVVGGQAGHNGNGTGLPRTGGKTRLALVRGSKGTPKGQTLPESKTGKEVSPEKAIPFDDDDSFQDF